MREHTGLNEGVRGRESFHRLPTSTFAVIGSCEKLLHRFVGLPVFPV